MPITYVLKVAVPSDQSIQQYKESLEKRLSVLKPRRLNKFQVQSIVYQSQNQALVHQYLHSDYSVTCFSVIEPAASQPNDVKVLTGDIGLASVQRRVCELGILSERKQLQIECVGSAFKLGDFQIKIGAVTQNSSNRGLLIEISYSSANNNSEAYGFILEFIQNYFGWTQTSSITEMFANLVRRKASNSPYTPEDTIIQYYEHFNYFRNLNIQQKST